MEFVDSAKCFAHSDAGDPGEGERDDDKGHFLAEQGKEDLLQRSLPQVKTLCTCFTAYLAT